MWWSDLAGKLEQASSLDPAADTTTDIVNKVLPAGPVKDLLHGRWLGHPLHPLMIALPIGLWSGASLLDLTAGEKGRAAAQRLVGAGLLAVVPTAMSGLADWSEVGSAKGAKRVGLIHMTANTVTAALYAGSWLARRKGKHARGRNLALAGVGTLTVGGYLGGHLAYSNAVGVNRNADVSKGPADWTDVAAVADVAEGQMHAVEVKGTKVMLTRRFGEFLAMTDTCSHWGGPLSEGSIDDEGCVTCPWHGSKFRLHDGSVAQGPATIPQISYEVRAVGERLEIRARQ